VNAPRGRGIAMGGKDITIANAAMSATNAAVFAFTS
jgi:hypothetical protein